MGKILGAYLLPHPPIIIEEIGKDEEKKAKNTIDGVKAISLDIKKKSPSTIIIITPHGPLFSDAVSISIEEELTGSFKKFGNDELKFNYSNNLKLVKEIINNSYDEDIAVAQVDEDFARQYNIDKELDHGTLVPLYFVDKEYKDYKLIHITYGILSPNELYRFGTAIERAVKDSDEDVIVIASGDLSHKLSSDGAYAYSPYGKTFDEKIVNIIKEGKMEDIISFDLDLGGRAGECGLRSLMIMAGTIGKYRLETEVLSYEGPFGVGYCTAKIDIVGENTGKDILEIIEENSRFKINKIRKNEHPYVELARESLEHYIRYGEYLEIPEEILSLRKGVFVTLKKDGMLRGCIGTIEPMESSIELEILNNAVSAGTKDLRFDMVKDNELEELVYSVDILSDAEPIKSMDELDVEKYGVIVSSRYKRGLLLPNLEGVDTVEEQVSIALSKANIRPDEEYTMERFEVVRYN